jgi:hypothetical protein
MLSASAPDFSESKINRLVDNVVATWDRTAPTRGTQMIFDTGVNLRQVRVTPEHDWRNTRTTPYQSPGPGRRNSELFSLFKGWLGRSRFVNPLILGAMIIERTDPKF